jgi:four helix bundle protein
MRDPGRLRVVEVALRVATLTYAATKQFPVAEWQGLVPQMRRAAVSIGSNITEGCGRSSEKQFFSFLQIATGSACELEFQCRLAQSLQLAPAHDLAELLGAVQQSKRMLAKLTVNIRARTEAHRP